MSAGLGRLVRESGWSQEAAPDYAQAIGDPSREHIGDAGARCARSSALLNSVEGQVRLQDMMDILRDHGSGGDRQPGWRAECAVQRTVCMHAGASDRGGQTVGSLVSELSTAHAVHWVTGTAAPCISIFKPVLLDAAVPFSGSSLMDRFDPRALWWRHERLHRAALRGDFAMFVEEIRAERDELEADFLVRIKSVLNGGSALERSRIVSECWKRAGEMEEAWSTRVPVAREATSAPYAAAWDEMNHIAGLESSLHSGS